MGQICPPAYGIEDVEEKIRKISEIDEKINELLILREQYVKDFKESIKK